MRIICTKYEWDISIAVNDINFFNSDAGSQTQTEIDLYPYLIKGSLGEFEYPFEKINSNNTLSVQASNVGFSLISNYGGGTDLSEFFEIDKVNPYIRFKVDFYDEDNELIFPGIIYKDGINCPNKKNAVLKIIAIDYTVEFQKYYANIPVVEYINEALLPLLIRDLANPSEDLAGLKFHRLSTAILQNFGAVNYNAASFVFLADWFMASRPYIYYPASNVISDDAGGLLLMKSGYESFFLDQVDRFTWFNSILLSMGWRWCFYLGSLNVQKRDEVSTQIKIYDYNNSEISLMEHGITNLLESYKVDNIIIRNGEYYGSSDTTIRTMINWGVITGTGTNQQIDYTYLGGNTDNVYSSTNPVINVTKPFKSLNFIPLGLRPPSYSRNMQPYKFNVEGDDDDYYHRQKQFRFGVTLEDQLEITNSVYPKTSTLIINPYIPDYKNSGVLDFNHARETSTTFYGNGNAYQKNHDFGTSGFGYTGNAGASLMQLSQNSLGDYWQNYDGYTRSEDFANQFKPFLKSPNAVLFDMTVNEFVSNPLQGIQIINYPYGTESTLNFTIQRMASDYFGKQTKFLLLKI